MSGDSTFSGFSEQCVKFWRDLPNHNDKRWFENHRDDYEQYVMAPCRSFILAMGEALQTIAPKIHADPRVNKSIFKINRDYRFSKDKSPYKTHMGLWFWEGQLPRMECSGFYFHLEPPLLILGSGIYLFSKPALEEYRRSVMDAKQGAALSKAIDQVRKKGDYSMGPQFFKKTPRGYDPGHKRADLLLYNALYMGTESTMPSAFYSADLVDYCMERYQALLPLHKWLLAMTERL